MVGLEVEDIRRLAELMQELGLGEIELADAQSKLRIKRDTHLEQYPFALPAGVQSPASAVPATLQPNEQSAPDVKGVVMSPMVGTVYVAPHPGEAPFVQVGSRVETGQIVLTLEAMKVMNPIKSPRNGTVTKILVCDGQPVEFGEHLMIIE